MKTPLSFYLAAAVAGTLGTLACSDDGGKNPRIMSGTGGSAGQSQVSNAGSSSGGSSGTGGGQGMSGAGGGGTTVSTGAALTITADSPTEATVKDDTGSTGINGAATTSQSPMGTTLTRAFRNGALCINGTAGQVLNGAYSDYWGGLVSIDLNRVANPDAPAGDAGAADAGGDGGAPVLGMIAQAWSPGNVVGFSFKIDGPTMPVSLRFQATPTNSDPSNDHFCANVPAVAGSTINVKFTEILRNCYDAAPGAALFADTAGFTKLQNINWQVSASDMLSFPFDFCVSEIKPILGN